jgi:Ca2+-binding RTX toxin-like protein
LAGDRIVRRATNWDSQLSLNPCSGGTTVFETFGAHGEPSQPRRNRSTARHISKSQGGTEAIEALETRRLYSTSSLSSGVLTIDGTSGVDTVYVSQAVGQVLVYDGKNSNFYDVSKVKKVRIDTGAGDDTIYVGLVDNIPTTIKGGSGNDDINAGDENDLIDGGDGSDDIDGLGGNDYIAGGGGANDISGGKGNDTLIGGDTTDQLFGGEGNDLLDGGLGADAIYGNEDIDTVTYASRTAPVYVDLSDALGEQADDGQAGEGDWVHSDVENIEGGAGNDVLVGNTFLQTTPPFGYTTINAINGNDGNDTIQGLDGNDVLNGGGGNDSIGGNAGRDKIFGGGGNDVIRGHGGNDWLYGQSNIDKTWGGEGNDWIDGGTSNDRLQGDNGDDSIIGGIGDDHVYAKNAGKDQVDGQDGFDDIRVDVLDTYKNCEDIG